MSHDSKTGHDLFNLAQIAATELASKPSIAEAAAGIPSMHARLLAEEELRRKRAGSEGHMLAPEPFAPERWETQVRPPTPKTINVNITVNSVFTPAHATAIVRIIRGLDTEVLAYDDDFVRTAIHKALEDVSSEDALASWSAAAAL